MTKSTQTKRYNHDEYYETGVMPARDSTPSEPEPEIVFKPLLREACTSDDYEDQFN